MFRRRADTQEPAELKRGPGGGRVRTRPRRKERLKKPPGLLDAAFLATVFGVGAFFVYHFLFKVDLVSSGLIAAVVIVCGTASSYYMNKRKQAKAAAAAPPPRRRR